MSKTLNQPKTGQKCTCRRGVWRDNCPKCEGTGWIIDLVAIHRARRERELAEDIHAIGGTCSEDD